MKQVSAPLVLMAIATFAVIVAALWLLPGLYQIKPGEATAVQTFGAARSEPITTPGLHWHWPSPIGRTTTLQVQKSRTAEVGFQTLPEGKIDTMTSENWQRDFMASTMITGDTGLVETQLVAHYYISDLNSYLFRADDPGVTFEYFDETKARTHNAKKPGRPDGQTIKDALEIAIRRSIGQMTIDQALVSNRETIESQTMHHAQDKLDQYQTGLTITSLQLQEVRPPPEVQDAFDDVLKAREEKDTRINQALAFESKTLPEARGQAARIRKEADAYRAQRVNAATAESNRFQAILGEYRSAPAIIAKRIYYETMDRVLPGVNLIIVADQKPDALIINTGDARDTVIPLPEPPR